MPENMCAPVKTAMARSETTMTESIAPRHPHGRWALNNHELRRAYSFARFGEWNAVGG
ncbi:MAG: hypothetical protein M3N18_09180 [Actinomycetota bacterium]|nr:hypothetical protein [Actinomycetota bacterium]